MIKGISVILELRYLHGSVPNEWEKGGYVYLFAPHGLQDARRGLWRKLTPPAQWTYVTKDGDWNEVGLVEARELSALSQSRFVIGHGEFSIKPVELDTEQWFGIPNDRDSRVTVSQYLGKTAR